MLTTGLGASELRSGGFGAHHWLEQPDKAEHSDRRDPPRAVEAQLHNRKALSPVRGDPTMNKLIDPAPADPQPLRRLRHRERERKPLRKQRRPDGLAHGLRATTMSFRRQAQDRRPRTEAYHLAPGRTNRYNPGQKFTRRNTDLERSSTRLPSRPSRREADRAQAVDAGVAPMDHQGLGRWRLARCGELRPADRALHAAGLRFLSRRRSTALGRIGSRSRATIGSSGSTSKSQAATLAR